MAVNNLDLCMTGIQQCEPAVEYVEYPSVCMNENGTVVVFFTRSGMLNYMVGVATADTSTTPPSYTMAWGQSQEIGDGCNVKAAINEQNEVVVVFSKNYRRICYYHFGQVDPSNKSIEWKGDRLKLCDGVNPSVAMRGQTVIFVYEAQYGTYRSYYRVCEIRDNVLWISLEDKEREIPELAKCKEIGVALNKDNTVMLSCRSVVGWKLYYAMARLEAGEIKDVDFVGEYASGYYPDISLLDNGCALSINENYVGGMLQFKFGVATNGGCVLAVFTEYIKRGQYDLAFKIGSFTMTE